MPHIGRVGVQPRFFLRESRCGQWGVAPWRGGLRLFRAKSFRCQGILYFLEKQGGLHWFGDVVTCPLLHGVHGVLHVGIARHDDKRGADICFPHEFQEQQSVSVRQPQVGQNEVEGTAPQQFVGFGKVACGVGVESLFVEPCLEHGGKSEIVFYDENVCHEVSFG